MNRKRLSDYGIRVGCMPTGPLDKITDVPGVTVGHATVRDARHHTGVTVIMPCEDNMFAKKLTAASFVLNGFGKTAGLVQVDELGTLETPIALTNTLNVGLVHDALVTVMAERCAADHVEELTVCNRRLGEEIIAKRNARPAPEPNDRGSIMMVTATDLPVSDRQLRRIIKRCSVGLARCGSYFGHGSGDVMIGFTTANRMPAGGMHRVIPQQVLTEHTLELAFRAIAEATQEAVLNSLCCADAVTAEDGRVFESISQYL